MTGRLVASVGTGATIMVEVLSSVAVEVTVDVEVLSELEAGAEDESSLAVVDGRIVVVVVVMPLYSVVVLSSIVVG